MRIIRVGVADAYTRIDPSSLSITASIVIDGRPPGAELDALARETDDGIYTLVLTEPLESVERADLFVEVADLQGNIKRVVRTFRVGETAQVPAFIRGDCNADSHMDVSDLVTLLNLFLGVRPLMCQDACDVNDDGILNLIDAISLILTLYGSAPEVPRPYPLCGDDPTGADSLDCRVFPICF